MDPLARLKAHISTRRNNYFAEELIFIAALLLRLIFISQWLDLPLSRFPLIDSRAYDHWAKALAAGTEFGGPAFYMAPFYAYFLAGMYKIFGVNWLLIYEVQAVAGALTCVIIFRTARTIFGFKEAVAAAALAAFYRPFIFYSALLMKETWAVLGIAMFFWLILQVEPRKNHFRAFFAGLCLGVTALSRGNVLFFGPATVLWWAGTHPIQNVKARFSCIAALTIGVLIAILPAAVHNFNKSHDLVLVSYSGGFNFYLGNRQSTSGFDNYPDDISSDPIQEEIDVTRKAEFFAGRKLKPSEVSEYWFNRRLAVIERNPAQWLSLMGKKLFAFWNHLEVPDNYNLEFTRSAFPTILRWPLSSFTLVSVLAAIGWSLFGFFSGETKLTLILGVVYMVSVVIFAVNDRYRLPMIVFLLPFAGAGCVWIYENLGRLLEKRARAPVLAGCVFLLIALAPPPFILEALYADGWSHLSTVAFRSGDYKDATKYFSKSIQVAPNWTKPEAYLAAALSYEKLSLPLEAERTFKAAIYSYPKEINLMGAYANFLMEQRRYDEARVWVKKSIVAKPEYEKAYMLYCRLQQLDGHKLFSDEWCAKHKLPLPGGEENNPPLDTHKVELTPWSEGAGS